MADYLDQFVPQGAEPVQAPTPVIPSAADLAQLTNSLTNPSQMMMLNLARERGNSLATDNQIVSDYDNTPLWNFQQQYGMDAARNMMLLDQGNNELGRVESSDRQPMEHVTDAVSGVATGLGGSLGDAGTLIAGALNENAGRFAVNTTQDFRNWMYDNTQTDASARNRFLSGMRSELDGQDNQRQYESDKHKDGNFIAGLSYLGRGLVNGAARYVEDPQSLEAGLSEGVGSLLAGGPMGRTLGVAGKLAGAGSILTKAAMPVAIGLMEGGSAYSGALQEVMGMSHEQLLASSPSFRELVAAGTSPDKAREKVAARAAEIAGAIQAPVGALTGKLVAGFEAHPLGSKGFREMVQNILHETVEEGAQSASGQLAQNLGVQQNADQNKSLLEDVGDQTAQGAILGSLTAGVVQVPSIPKVAISNAISALGERAKSIQTANESGSGVTEADLRAAANTATENLAPVAQAADTLAQAVPEELRKEVGADTFKSRIEGVTNVSENDIRSIGGNTLSYFKDNGIEVPQNRGNLILSTARAAMDENASPEVRTASGLFLLDEMERQTKLFDEDIEEAKGSLDQTSDEYQAITQYQNLMAQLRSSQSIASALDWVKQNASVNVEDNAPVSQETVQNAVRATTAKPSALTANGVRTILKQADEGTVTVTPEQRKGLLNSAAVIQIGDKAVADLAQTDKDADYETPAVKDVAQQILQTGMTNNPDWGLSVNQHVGRFNAALQSGDMTGADAALRHFGNFAASQRNKARAALQSIQNGGEKTFARIGSYGRRNPVDGKITIHANSPGSLALGRRVTLEANMLIDQVNALIDANPEVGVITKLERLPLPTEFFGQQQDKATQQSEPKEETTNDTVQTETPVSEAPVEDTDDITEEMIDAPLDENGLWTGADDPADKNTPTEKVDIQVNNEAVDDRTSLEKKFPFLVRTKTGLNRFIQAFSDSRIGRMLERGEPLNDFIEALNTGATAIEYVGEDPRFNIDGNQAEALQDYLKVGIDLINGKDGLAHRLRTFAGMEFKDGQTFGERIRNGEDVAGTVQGRSVAILEKTSKNYQYNPALIQSATLAALHWFAGSQNRQAYHDKESLSKELGIDMSEIKNSLVEQFNAGVGLTQAARGLAENISQFWGLAVNKNAPENLAKGIPEAIAKELLEVMETKGFMTSEFITLPNGKEYKQYYFGENIDPNIRTLLREMGPAKKLIEMSAIPSGERAGATYGTPPEHVAPTQMRNKAVRNTKTQRAVIRKAQSIPFYFYRNSYDMQRAIGKDAWIELMGSTVIGKNTPFNAEHKKSIEGRNLTITQSFDSLEDQVAELEAHANGGNPEELKKFYQFNFSRVNRLQMLGLVSPQSDKIARHVFLPTKTTLDLTDPESDHSIGFFMATAQGLGEKTQHYSRTENAAKGYSMTLDEDGKYFPLVQELQQWLKDGKKASLTEWSKRARAVDPGITEHGVMSLLSVAEYANARDAGQLSSFTTHNYFEADGVTNGAANALMNLSTTVSPEWINTVRKGGAFIGFTDRAMNSQKGTPDLYQASGDTLAELQRDFINNLPDDVRDIHDALFRMMQGLGMKITFDNGEIKIDRKVLKNPLTITIYGSGVDGIAGNVASELMDNFYEAISDHLQSGKNTPFGEGMMIGTQPYGAQQFWSDLSQVLNNVVVKNDNALTVEQAKFAKELTGLPSNEQLKKLSMSPNEFRTLRDNVRALFVDNMDKAIKDQVMGHVGSMVDNIQKATNAQSIIMSFMFRKELIKAMADRQINPDKYPDYKRGDFLSQAEMDEILQRLMPYGAVINTEHQSFFLGSGERSNLLESTKVMIDGKEFTVRMPESYSRTLMDRLKTAAFAYAPGIAGVAGVPSFNIGTGDGRMIDIFLQALKGFGVLPVFDGINIPVDRIFEGSQMANTAVMQSWTENPVQHVAESFRAFLRQNPLDLMFDQNDPFNVEMAGLALELTKNAEGVRKPAEALTKADLQLRFEDLMTSLENGQQQVADRIEAMKEFPMSVDQMAGGMTPYSQTGSVKLPVNASDAQISQALENQMKKVAANRTKGEVISAPSREFVAAFRSKAATDPDTGALVADVTALDAVRKTINNKLTNAHREMLNAAIQSLTDSGLTVVFGTPEMVDRYEQNNYPASYEADGSSYYGKIDVENNVIYLTNPSAETLAHELIHAATITKMQGYYTDKSSVSQTDGEAIARLEGLMNEWLVQSYDREGPAVSEAHRMAISTIVGLLNQNRMPEALNEFLAWSLTNQNIINLQKKMQVKNPLYRIMGQALTALKQLIWGHKKAPEVGNDMFSNVRFNARVLMASPTPVALFMKDFGDVVMYQSSQFGTDPRLSELRKQFGQQMLSFVRTAQTNDTKKNAAAYVTRRQDALEALLRNHDLANRMAVPFHMNMQQISTFKMIGATLSVAQHLNSASLARMQTVFDAVIEKITPDNFKTNQGDPQIDEYQAQEKFRALTGVGTTAFDGKNRSSLLPNFIALAMIDDGFRAILRGMNFPATVMDKSWKPDALVERAGAAVAAGLATYASGQGRENIDLLAAMDALTQNLVENIGDQRSFIEQRVDNGLDNADKFIQTYIEKGAKKAENWAKTLQSPVGKKAAAYITILSRSLTEEGTKSLNRTGVSFFNQPEIKNAQREAFNEIVGRTEENSPIFDMITKARTFVDQTRQRWREEYPAELRKMFARKLSKEEWAHLHMGLGKTDAAGLFDTYRRDRTLELLSSGSARSAEISALESRLKPVVIAKAKQLANFMITGDHGPQLQPNAHAIAVLNQMGEYETDIDNLVSLYALDNLPDNAKQTLEKLSQDDGFSKVLASLVATRNDELAKGKSGVAKMNAYKGHMKGLNQDGVHLVIDSKQNHGQYMSMGYVSLGDYKGSTADIGTEKKAYYFAPVSGRAKFNQGVMQTVQQSFFGVNPETGFSVGEITAGRITDQRAVAAISRRIQNQTITSENLRPIYAENGRIIAYERMADPKQLSQQNPTYDLAQAMGAWRGRQSEELASRSVNEELVNNVFDIWQKGKLEHRTNEYVAMDRSTDPVISDAWNVIPHETKEYIKSKFGQDGFMVQRGMLLDVAGARSASVGDLWTGNSRWSPVVQKEIKDLVVGFAGNKAYRILVNAEETFQNLVTDAKVLIVIKSMIVPAANFVSNIYQLSMNGVPVRHIFEGFKKKTFELNTYIKQKEQERQLQTELFVAEGANDSVKIRKLSTRLQTIRDGYKSLSIWPLLEVGEFGAITDGGISQEDLAISRGGYLALVEGLVKKLPDGVRDVARYGMVTRDTALFKALSRATQYGDFLGKAILYDDLMRRKNLSSQEALAYISEEFVNYNRFAGRNRAYLESMGMTWFYNFKLRSMKIAQRMLHKHPVRALIHTALTPRIPLLGSVGNPMTDNMLSIVMDGRLGYSTGPSMLFRAPQLNPWLSMVD